MQEFNSSTFVLKECNSVIGYNVLIMERWFNLGWHYKEFDLYVPADSKEDAKDRVIKYLANSSESYHTTVSRENIFVSLFDPTKIQVLRHFENNWE
jgi:hypothetical protein